MKPDPSRNSLIERCKRICGTQNTQCLIDTPSQVACIADMVINKSFGISLMLKHALDAGDLDEARQYIGLALGNSSELSNWVRYLQVASDLRDLLSLAAAPGGDKRRETRYPLPDVYRQCITLQILPTNGNPYAMVLQNFSQSGFQARSPQPFAIDEQLPCSLSLIQTPSTSVQLTARVKYCAADGDGYIIGAAIEDVSDSSDFNFFNNVLDLITELGGTPERQV